MRDRRLTIAVLFALLPACGSSRGGGDDDDSADGDVERRCLDADGQPTDDCEVEPVRESCDLDETADCGILTLEEVWADDGETGTCLHIVVENRCEDTLYSWTCIEHGGPVAWQCWLSTTLPGFDVDVSQCDATGNYAHYGSLSDGTLDIIHERCDPSA